MTRRVVVLACAAVTLGLAYAASLAALADAFLQQSQTRHPAGHR